MKCPYCGKEMKEGYIPAFNRAVQWIPKGEHVPLTFFQKAKGSIRLSKNPKLALEKALSYYCEKCKTVITPVKW